MFEEIVRVPVDEGLTLEGRLVWDEAVPLASVKGCSSAARCSRRPGRPCCPACGGWRGPTPRTSLPCSVLTSGVMAAVEGPRTRQRSRRIAMLSRPICAAGWSRGSRCGSGGSPSPAGRTCAGWRLPPAARHGTPSSSRSRADLDRGCGRGRLAIKTTGLLLGAACVA